MVGTRLSREPVKQASERVAREEKIETRAQDAAPAHVWGARVHVLGVRVR